MPSQVQIECNARGDSPLPFPLLRPLPAPARARANRRHPVRLTGVVHRLLRGTMRRVLRGLTPGVWMVFAVVALSGCVSTNATLLDVAPSAKRAPLPADQVRIYRLASQVPGRYDELALINSQGAHSVTNEKKMLESMRKKAGELGANGLILEGIVEPSAGAKVAATVFGVSAERKGKAVAIYVHADTVRPSVTPRTDVRVRDE